jgi:hypothetical protein
MLPRVAQIKAATEPSLPVEGKLPAAPEVLAAFVPVEVLFVVGLEDEPLVPVPVALELPLPKAPLLTTAVVLSALSELVLLLELSLGLSVLVEEVEVVATVGFFLSSLRIFW